MKKTLLMAASCLMLFACKKSDNGTSGGGSQANTSFTLRSPNAYIAQEVEVGIAPQSGVNYNVDFGDGSSTTSTGYPTHKYTAGGTYTITVKSGSASSTKKVRIFPGTSSYQINNNYPRTITGITSQTVNSNDVGIVNASTVTQLTYKQTSDTVFVNVPSTIQYDPRVRTSFGWTNPYTTQVGFVVTSAFFLSQNNHKVFTIESKTGGTYNYRGISGTFTVTGTVEIADSAR